MKNRPSRVVRATWVFVASIAAIMAVALTLLNVSALPSICGMCHEMSPAVASWRVSGHTKVGCASCHEPARAWYAFPVTLFGRSAMLARDISLHLARDPQPSEEATPTIPDSTCERCHDPSRAVTMRFGTLINHAEHAKRNGSCLSCHLDTAHPDPTAERPMLLMERCFACHGRTKQAKAPGTCDVCHPKSFSLRPASHAPPTKWRTAHGEASIAQQQPCAMCHEKTFCDGCHGLQMPHPAGWAVGIKPLHASIGERDRQVCAQCHTDKPDLCSMCHHKGWEPARGTWVAQHPLMVDQRGANFCFQCHTSTFCFDCHLPVQEKPATQ
jgi:hypothetical protein